MVENHQGVEAVEMKLRQTLRAAHHHDVGHTAAQHVGTRNQGVRRRRAGRRERCHRGELAKGLGNHLGTCPTMVRGNLCMHHVAVGLVGMEQLTTIHTAHCGGRDKRNRLQVVALQAGLLQGFA